MKARTADIRGQLFFSAFLLALIIAPRADTATITFDDLPGGDVANGYGGLRWGHLIAYNASKLAQIYGYQNGMVSPSNVVFNPDGYAALIWNWTNSFDLQSAYLTAAVPGTTQVRVQGFVGPMIAYDHTYSLSMTPSLVQFNYFGVSQVRFTPIPEFYPFLMDNLEATVRQSPVAHVAADLGEVSVPFIGHAFGYGDGTAYVNDLLIDQEAHFGGGGRLSPAFVNWDANDQFVLTVAAPAGMKFRVKPPTGKAVRFFGNLMWTSPRTGSFSVRGAVAARFRDLEGTPPDFSTSSSLLLYGYSGFGFDSISSIPFTNELTFTSVTMTGTLPAQHAGLGMLDFVPLSYCYLGLSYDYDTRQTNDPGRFVFLVPSSPRPTIRITERSAASGTVLFVQGQAGRTNVLEGSADLIHWAPISTNVMPFTLCPICPYVIATDAAGKDSAQRFYRVFEQP